MLSSHAFTGGSCIVAMFVTLIILTTACSKDDAIIKDYKLYDLDGSNQIIIGGAGMVKVADVTAYNVERDRIYFETGVLDAPIMSEDRSQFVSCRYGFIDIAKNVVVTASVGSVLQKTVERKLSSSSKGVVSRSCVGVR